MNTDQEPKWNTVTTCKTCMSDRLERWQKKYSDLKIEIGSFCKIGFLSATGKTEWMWVEVTDIVPAARNPIRGKLNNDPVVATDWKDGDPVEFQRNQICEYIEKPQ